MRLSLRVKGKVQGVGFRYFVSRIAHEMGLSGWVQNLPDGDVEAEIQGDEKMLEDFMKKLKDGHSWARVDSVQSREIPEKAGAADFEILG